MPRPRRGDHPSDPAAALRAMRICREAMIEICRTVKPRGPVYHGAGMVISAIDAFAALLTGRPDYFAIEGSAIRPKQGSGPDPARMDGMPGAEPPRGT